MKIIIPRIPKTTTKRELRELVAAALDKRFHIPFTEHPHVAGCDIISIRDHQGVIELHGLVTVLPEQAGAWLLHHFKGQHLHGKLILARQYCSRRSGGRVFDPESDRRRPGLEITTRGAHIAVEGISQFAQLHN